MKFRHLLVVLFISPLLMQGLCNKEDVKQDCTDIVTWDGSGLNGFYKSTEHDSHFRELYFNVPDPPSDICIDAEVQAIFRVGTLSGASVNNILHIEGRITWGDHLQVVILDFSDTEHAYIGTIERIDLKPYFNEHPTADGSGFIEVEFNFSDLSIGNEANDLKFVTDNITSMNVQVQYVRK